MNNKAIGLFQGIALYISAILGSGVLFLSGVTLPIAALHLLYPGLSLL